MHVHCLRNAIASDVASIVRWEIGFSQRAVVTIAKRDRLRVAEPRIVIALHVPEMLVRVDD